MLLPLTLACAVLCASGCASARFLSEDEPEAAPRLTAYQSYQAGLSARDRGDEAQARRHWDSCISTSSPDSQERLDCMVALEQTASSSARP